ncbi:sigma factor-like helix-turn-helix DNA-binding protein [Actinoplanes sp. ATCC 53533]|uniref:sigma factor-like helix-turn-helix DNA-binding protein n=1 Tax=Actinoplanes sp. ATCC 53533 TaxID=1288362 RepID=UPI0026B48F4C
METPVALPGPGLASTVIAADPNCAGPRGVEEAVSMVGDGPTFAAFFERQHADLSRLAYLLTGDPAAADDLAADALGRVRRDWPRVGGDDPAAYARGLVATLTRGRERRGLFGTIRRTPAPGREAANRPQPANRREAATRPRPANRREAATGTQPGAQATEVRGALRRLPHRRRVCVVLRYAFGLTEDEVARALGISAGAARTRTSRGARQLSELLGDAPGVSRLRGWEAAR